MMVDLGVPPMLLQRLIYVYESDFQIQNLESSAISQNDHWFLHIPRLSSLFCSKAHGL